MLSRYFLRIKKQIPNDGLCCRQKVDDVCRFCNEYTDRALVLICGNFICGNCLSDFRSTGSLSLTCTICYSLTIVPAPENHSDKICLSTIIPSDTNSSSCDRFLYMECLASPLGNDHENRRKLSNMLTASYKSEKYHPLMASNSSSFEDNVDQLHPLLKAKFYDLQKSLDYCGEFSDHLSQKSRDQLSKIDQSIDHLKQLLESRRQILRDHYNDLLNKKLNRLKRKSDEIQKTQNLLLKSLNNSKFDFDESIFPNLTALSSKIEEKLVEEDEDLIIPRAKLENESVLSEMIENFGEICDRQEIRIKIHDDCLSGYILCCTNKKTKIRISYDTDSKEKTRFRVNRIFLLADFDDKKPEMQVKPGNEDKFGKIPLVFKLKQEGLYSMHFCVENCDVVNSPLRIKCVNELEFMAEYCSVHGKSRRTSVNSSISSFSRTTRSRYTASPDIISTAATEDDLVMQMGTTGIGLGRLTNPQGVCATPNGKVIVADSHNQCIQTFAKNGECVLKFGVRGRSSGQLLRPTGLALLPNDNLLVADYDNKWIAVYSLDGKYLGRFAASVGLLGPKGICVDRDGHVIIVDNKSSTIFVFDMTKFKIVRKFGARGDRPQQLAGPHYASVDSRNRIFISDFHHHQVKIFDCSGKFLSQFGAYGSGNGQFVSPTGLAIDGNDRIFVADWGNNRIQAFDTSTSFLGFINSYNSSLFGPQGVCTINSDCIAVADSGNHCVKLYRYL